MPEAAVVDSNATSQTKRRRPAHSTRRVEAVRYTSEAQDEWDAFVWQARNGTLFHTQRFLGYHPVGRFDDHSLLFRYKGRTLAVLPLAAQVRDGERILRSHPGASYGGPALDFESDLSMTHAVVDALVRFAKDERFDAVEMRFPPRVFHRYPCEDLDFALARHGFEITQRELTSAISLSGGEAEWKRHIRSDTARSLRKAVKEPALSVQESDDWGAYWTLLEQNLRYHNAHPTHTLAEIRALKRLFPERVRLVASYLEEHMTAGVVCFSCNDQALHTFYMAQDYDYQRYRSLNLVLYRLMQWGTEEGYRFLNLGISTEEGGDVVNWGLFRFKEGFGARGVLRTYYRLDLCEG